MFEVSWTTKRNVLASDEVIDRLTKFLAIAKTLRKAGWPFCLTMTGLEIETPDANECDNRAVAEKLANIGIREPLSFAVSRTSSEVKEWARALNDRVWHEDMSKDKDVEISPHDQKSMEVIEKEGLLQLFQCRNDVEWGILIGKLAALNWVLGTDWRTAHRAWPPSLCICASRKRRK